MDQDETQVVEEPTLTETKAEEAEGHDGEKPGKVVQTFLVRVTLRVNPGDEGDEARADRASASVPTNDEIARIIADGLYARLNYFADAAINVTAEKV
jgi:hypothetical protein